MQYDLYKAIRRRPNAQHNLRNVFYIKPFLEAISTMTFHKRYNVQAMNVTMANSVTTYISVSKA